MSAPGLYEQVMAHAGGQAGALPRPPRASAAVVLWRRGLAGLEVFWIKRSESLAFMGGWHAFPGGSLMREDAAIPVAGEPRGAEGGPSAIAMPETLAEGLPAPPPNLVPGIAACALRELLEETGVLPLPELFGAAGDGLELEAELGSARRALLAGDEGLATVAARHGLRLDASRLVFAGRWLTPPLGPLRFDNRFFLLEWPATFPVQPLVIEGEAESGEWVAPGEAYLRWLRGEVLTAPPILHLLKVLVQQGPEAGLERLREPAEANLGPFRRVEFRPGVILLPLPTATLPPARHTNAFLLGRGERVLIDPGTAEPRVVEQVVAAARAAEEAGHRVTAIWLTHHHPDHVAGVPALAARLGLPVWAHRATAERLADPAYGPPVAVDRLLEDGERIVLAGDPPFPVRVLHTPGHARGHLCFLDEEGGSLIAGDMLSALSTIVIAPPEGEMSDYLASLERLHGLAPATLFPSHGPPIKNGTAHLRQLISHRLRREEKVLAAWRDGHRTPAEIRPHVYEEDLPPMLFPLAELQIEAHLARLRQAEQLA